MTGSITWSTGEHWEAGEWLTLAAPRWFFAQRSLDRLTGTRALLLGLDRRWANILWRARTTRRAWDRDTKLNLGGDVLPWQDRELYRKRRGHDRLARPDPLNYRLSAPMSAPLINNFQGFRTRLFGGAPLPLPG